MLVACVLLSLLLLILLVAVVRQYRARERFWRARMDRQSTQHTKDVEELNRQQQIAIEALETTLRQRDDWITRLTHSLQYLLAQMLRADEYYKRQSRVRWTSTLGFARYADKAEVNTRFVYRLLLYLEYPDYAMEQNAPVNIRADLTMVETTVDWLIWSVNGTERLAPLMFIYTVEPGVDIDDVALAQAHSRAYGVGVPVYGVTNGRRMVVCRYDVRQDRIRLDTLVNNLPFLWDELVQEMGYDRIVDLQM